MRAGLAGEVAQKFATYRVGLAVVGDVTQYTIVSSALRDFIRETNTGRQLWFIDDREALDAQLANLA